MDISNGASLENRTWVYLADVSLNGQQDRQAQGNGRKRHRHRHHGHGGQNGGGNGPKEGR